MNKQVAAWPFKTIEDYDRHETEKFKCYLKLRTLHEEWMSAYNEAKRGEDEASRKD